VLSTSALLTDRYELTMLQAALRSGKAHRRGVFEVFSRNLAGGRRYGVFAGTGRLLRLIEQFRFHEEEISWLLSHEVVDIPTLRTGSQTTNSLGTSLATKKERFTFPTAQS
jgi:nicotinate phosphoribosyltransferase